MKNDDGLRLIQNRPTAVSLVCFPVMNLRAEDSAHSGRIRHWRGTIGQIPLFGTSPTPLTLAEGKEARNVEETGLMQVYGIRSALTKHRETEKVLSALRGETKPFVEEDIGTTVPSNAAILTQTDCEKIFDGIA